MLGPFPNKDFSDLGEPFLLLGDDITEGGDEEDGGGEVGEGVAGSVGGPRPVVFFASAFGDLPFVDLDMAAVVNVTFGVTFEGEGAVSALSG